MKCYDVTRLLHHQEIMNQPQERTAYDTIQVCQPFYHVSLGSSGTTVKLTEWLNKIESKVQIGRYVMCTNPQCVWFTITFASGQRV